MAHQALARKWRPHNFSEVVGQPHVVQALSNALNQQHLHHAYLFTGTRGVGKTTIARIIAKSLNCEQGISANPCGTCSTCEEIDTGRFPDLYEVDAASRTKVEDTRELLDNVQYAPTKGRYKVYLIDEVHMLSGHSFNALLKTLEEPPEHVKFLLATTDYQRLPATVLSRCLQFHLQLLTPEEIAGHLETILTAEKIDYEAPATALIGKAAKGSMRDALSLLDQSIAFGNGKIITAEVEAMLGTIEPTTLFEILAALNQQDANALLNCAEKLNTKGSDFSSALADLLSLLHKISVTQLTGSPLADQPEQVQQLAQTINSEDVQLYYQIALLGQRDLPHAPTPRVGFEMTLLRMLAFMPQTPGKTTNIKKPTATTINNTTNTSSSSAASTAAPTPAQPKNASTNYWRELLPQIDVSGLTFALAQQLHLHKMNDNEFHFHLDSKHKPLLQDKYVKQIQDALNKQFNKTMKVTVDIAKGNVNTPASLAQQEKEDKLNAAERAIYNDKHVQNIMQTFDATVIKDSISPVETQH